MPPDTEPSPPAPDTSDDAEYLSEVWLDLDWSPWVPFNAHRDHFYIPKAPGVYRIRPAGKDFLMYIGETGQSLHKKLAELRQALRRGDIMPWSDPHDVAPCIWVHWTEWIAEANETRPKVSPEGEEEPEPVMLEFSAAPLDASPAGRKGMERFLLYRYRQEHGESTLCNFGRFHPRFRKSSKRAEGRRGGRLGEDQKDNPAGFPSMPPLEPWGKPGDPDWMGLEWTEGKLLTTENLRNFAPGAGLYLLLDARSTEVLYIGHAADIGKRLLEHSRKTWGDKELIFSYQFLGEKVLPHNLKELENDLIGNFYERFKKVPEFQFKRA